MRLLSNIRRTSAIHLRREPTTSFINKVVIVTGASSGIGAVTAVELTKQGADVVIVGRNQAKLKKVTADCEKAGGKPLVVNADLTSEADVKKVIESTLQKFGKIDVLVNNAGAGRKVNFDDPKAVAVFDELMAVNLRSVVHLTYLAAPHLTKTKGNVVNISSVAAMKTNAESWAYCTAKAGLDHFSRCIAAELASKGVKVNIVNPGPVRTDFVENMGIEDVEAFYKNMAHKTPLKRISEPTEIADVILFLASDKAKGVTGSSWVSDDGYLII